MQLRFFLLLHYDVKLELETKTKSYDTVICHYRFQPHHILDNKSDQFNIDPLFRIIEIFPSLHNLHKQSSPCYPLQSQIPRTLKGNSPFPLHSRDVAILPAILPIPFRAYQQDPFLLFSILIPICIFLPEWGCCMCKNTVPFTTIHAIDCNCNQNPRTCQCFKCLNSHYYFYCNLQASLNQFSN